MHAEIVLSAHIAATTTYRDAPLSNEKLTSPASSPAKVKVNNAFHPFR
jgi:hypothetical protein